MNFDDIDFLANLNLAWPPPEQVVIGLVLPDDLDSRIPADEDG